VRLIALGWQCGVSNYQSSYLVPRPNPASLIFKRDFFPSPQPKPVHPMSAVLAADELDARRGEFHEIPVIDFSDAYSKDLDKRKALSKKIYDACVDVGFFYIKNHGVPDSVMKNIFGAAKEFFELPMEDKLAIDLQKSPHFRGYTRLMVLT